MLNTFILAFLVVVLTVPTAYAQPVPAGSTSPVNFPVSTFRNVTTFGASTVNPANVNRFAFAVATDGLVVADAATGLPLPSGQSVPVTVSSRIPKASLGPALARFAQKSLPFLSTGYALYDLAKEVGFDMINQDGTLVVSKPSDPSNYTSPVPFSGVGAGSLTQFTTLQGQRGGCYLLKASEALFSVVCGVSTEAERDSRTSQGWTWFQGNPGPFMVRSPNFTTPTAAASVPSTVQEFTDAVAARSGWPSSSALARAAKDAIESGETLPVTPTTVSGPDSTPGLQSITQSGNTTTQNTTTNNHSYAGNTVTTTVVNNTTTFNNTTGDTISSTTTTTTPDLPPGETQPETPDPPCGIPGKPPCDVKIDETGTPDDGARRLDDDKTNFGTIRPTFDAAIADIDQIEAPAWTWTFALPTGCAPLPLGAFGFDVNICQFQPTIHDLMSLVWIAAGIFGLLGLLRSALGGQT